MSHYMQHPVEVVRRAAMLAWGHHEGRIRWYSNDSYYFHVERVADTVGRSHDDTVGNTRDLMLVAALLHDSVEDTDYTFEQAAIDFPELPDLPPLLKRLTHDAEGGESYADYVYRCKAHPLARIIKRADMADNISTLPFDSKLWYKYVAGLEILSQ